MSLAVRRRNGEIYSICEPLSSLYTGRLRRLLLVRGVIVLVETLGLGFKALERSARLAIEDVAAEEGEEVPRWFMGIFMALAFVLALGLFLIVPLFLVRTLDTYIASDVLSNLVEGAIRLAVFVAYLGLVSFIPDVKRVFAYHGAEHKTIHAYEAGVPLEAESIRKYSTAHARCGTAFLLAVLIIAIIVFALIGRQVVWLMVLSRILLLPVIAALGYEATQFGARHMNNGLVRALVTPGLWLQGLTTREPDDSQIEVAVAALQQAVAVDQGEEVQPTSS